MGEDKSQLFLGDERMLDRQVRVLRSVCRTVSVLGPRPSLARFDLPVLPDEFPGRGPLGGIYTGLLHTRTEFSLFLSCDLPFVDAHFLGYLCRRALESGADATVPGSLNQQFEPLCAVYRRRALRAVRRSLESGENKVARFFAWVRTELIPWPEVSHAGFSPRIFVNMNTAEDYAEVKRSFAASAAGRH